MPLAKGAKIFGGSFGATKKSGFGALHGSPVTKAPKLSDQFFVTFESTSNQSTREHWDGYSSKVKNVSGVSINTTFITLDQYGKRVHIPTRVDFGQITLTMYDTVDGSTFKLVSDIYQNNFKNNNVNTSNGSLAQSIVDPMLQGAKHTGFQELHYFTRVTVYDFFGDIYNEHEKSGQMQKVEIINPLITNIAFSDYDYSNGADVKMITITMQPENLIIKEFGAPNFAAPNAPAWLSEGLDYIDTKTNPNAGKNNAYDSEALANMLNELIDETSGLTGEGERGEGYTPGDTAGIVGNPYEKQSAAEIVADTQQRFSSTDSNEQARQLDKLRKEYNATKFASSDAERQEARDAFLKTRNETSPINTSNFVDPLADLNTTQQGVGIKIPNDIPGFADSVTQAIGSGNTTIGSSLNSALKSELVNSFFNGTKFDLGSVATKVAHSLVGNTGIGAITTANRTSSSKFGIAGDMLRDGIKNSIAPPATPSTRPTTVSAKQRSEKDNKQADITSIRNSIGRR